LGYPVALKVMSRQIVHKTEAGAIALDLRSELEVRTAYAHVCSAATAMIDDTTVGRILRGVRGRPAADIDAVGDLVVRLAELCVDLGDALEAVDINPLVVYEASRGIKVLDAALVLRAETKENQ
jgi:acyl-CoA synthetase (NDP forming)